MDVGVRDDSIFTILTTHPILRISIQRKNLLPNLTRLDIRSHATEVGTFIPPSLQDNLPTSLKTISEMECTICMEPLGDYWTMPCKNHHAFHNRCLSKWVETDAALNGIYNVHCPDGRERIIYPNARSNPWSKFLRAQQAGNANFVLPENVVRPNAQRQLIPPRLLQELDPERDPPDWPYTPEQEMKLLRLLYYDMFLKDSVYPWIADPQRLEYPIVMNSPRSNYLLDLMLYGHDEAKRRLEVIESYKKNIRDARGVVELLQTRDEYAQLPNLLLLVRRLEDLGVVIPNQENRTPVYSQDLLYWFA